MKKLPSDIKAIDERIGKFKTTKKAPKSATSTLLNQAFRFTAEFISPVIIALALGYLADKMFNTKPVIMLILAVFGCAAGVLNAYKAAQEVDKDMN